MKVIEREIRVINEELNVISYTVNYPACDEEINEPLISDGMSEHDLKAVERKRPLFFVY